MKFKKVLITGFEEAELNPEVWKRLDSLTEQKVFAKPDSSEIAENYDADCILIKFNKTDKELLANFKNLKYIGALATGFNQVDVDFAKSKSIIVTNVPGYSTESVAEFIIAALLNQIRGLDEGRKRGKSGNYAESGIKAIEVKDKVFGILGLGTIGKRVAALAEGFNADVRYWSREKKNVPFKYQEIDELIANSDFLSINLAYSPELKGFLSAKRIGNLKEGAVVINTAPMELVDIDALVKRLEKKDITFILDHSDEMEKGDLERLTKLENCIIYPPIAYISEEAKKNKQEIFIENIENFLSGKPTNVVN